MVELSLLEAAAANLSTKFNMLALLLLLVLISELEETSSGCIISAAKSFDDSAEALSLFLLMTVSCCSLSFSTSESGL